MDTKDYSKLDYAIKDLSGFNLDVKDATGVKASDDAQGGDGNTVFGLGSVFGNVDLAGEVVMPYAFDKSLLSGRKIKMLWQHDKHWPIGTWDEVTVDETGLRVKGTLANTSLARDAKELASKNILEGLSIGYWIVKDRYDENGIRYLEELILDEVSIVTEPCNQLATFGIKEESNIKRKIEKILREAGNFSIEEAKVGVKNCFKGIEDLREAKTKEPVTSDVEVSSEHVDANSVKELMEIINKRRQILK